jgi:hypothetical protein
MMGRAASRRVPGRTQNLDFWNMETANQEIALGTNNWNNFHWANAIVHPVTGKEMEYMAIMKDPVLQPL